MLKQLMKNRTLIEIKDLKVNFRTVEGMVHALDDINLELREGEILGLIGESGSGKSTIAMSILGLLAENAEVEGSIRYLGMELSVGGEEARLSEHYQHLIDELGELILKLENGESVELETIKQIIASKEDNIDVKETKKLEKEEIEMKLENENQDPLDKKKDGKDDEIKIESMDREEIIRLLKTRKRNIESVTKNRNLLKKILKARAIKKVDQRLANVRWGEISMIFQGAMNAFNPVHTIRRQMHEVFQFHDIFKDLSKYGEREYFDEKVYRARAYDMAIREYSGDDEKQFKQVEERIYNEIIMEAKAKVKEMNDMEKRKYLESIMIESSCLKAGFNPKFLDSYPHELSGGMKQRGIIAMALCLNPKVVIADEPTTGLDVITQAKIIRELKKLKDDGIIKSMIIISHDVGVVSQLANFVAVMYAGRIMEYGSPEYIFLNQNNPYTYALLKSYPSLTKEKSRIMGIPGAVPDLLDPPEGCYFASRCFMAQNICTKEKPTIKTIGEEHYSLCHYNEVDEGIYLEKFNEMIKNVGELKGEKKTSNENEPLIYTEDLSEYFFVHSDLGTNLFGGANRPVVHAVEKVNIKIPKGSIVGVVGESGSGKTTLGRLLVNAIKPTSGKIYFKIKNPHALLSEQSETSSKIEVKLEKDLKKMDEKMANELRQKDEIYLDVNSVWKSGELYKIFRSEAQLIFQDPYDSIDPKMAVFDIVSEPLIIQRDTIMSRRKMRGEDENFDLNKEVINALSVANLRPPENYLDRYPHELSGGERQRVCISRVITLNPSFIVADEPISMLDVSIRANILNLLLELKEKYNTSILYISHDIASARYVSDTLLIMYLGQIVEYGPAEDVIKNPMHPYTKALISSVPSIDPNWSNRQIDIIGEIGNAINPKPGCRFYSRCVYRKDKCKEEDPPEIEDQGRVYKCFFKQSELKRNEVEFTYNEMYEVVEEIDGDDLSGN
ncbi:ABC transporter ATP-binding protein [Caldiplasma sukawensis]